MTDQIPYKPEHLHIIKASAGSGKTHRLTGEYLHLLFAQTNNHRHILAVTFTNKATDEMKSRIVEELHLLSSGKSSAYLNELMRDFSFDEPTVRSMAKRILETILHDYSSFSISTIDKFFQQTMRAFTREMGLAGGYNVEVDHSSLLMETVDLMLSELDKPENKLLAEWLLQFMKDSIEDGKSWKIDREVMELSEQLFNETFKSFSTEEQEAFQNKEQLSEYKKILIRIIRDYESELKKTGARGVSIIEENSLEASYFKGGSRSQFFKFLDIAQGKIPDMTKTFLEFPDNLEGWYTKKTASDIIIKIENAYTAGLNDCVKQVIEMYENNRQYLTAKCILQNYYTLGILNDIKNRLRKLQQENNTLLLSDTTELLNDIISGTDSPFIYEKTGTRITNYMIDEFQDTSRMQWNNFKPLVDESLSSGNFNLIVGDVKQSIYRFRNSDWRLLEEQVEEDFSRDHIKKHVLDTNWRSDAKIVEFNNLFFNKAPLILQDYFNSSNSIGEDKSSDQITSAYRDVHQQLPDKKKDSGGHVKISFLKDDKENDWKNEALERLVHEIESLQDQGFALKDIAVVVRWNKEAVLVAEKLLKYKEEHPDSRYRYDIISNEALLIGSAQSVKSAVALMYHFRNPTDELYLMTAVYEFFRYKYKYSPDEAIKAYREESKGKFPEEYRSRIAELSTMPFYDMIESFFSLFTNESDENENAYIQAFLDVALKFSEDKSANLNAFLDWWEEKGCKKALYSPEGQDAIRLITIHKSKGLGFGAVIMPFVNWDLDHTRNGDIIWCKPEVAPFNLLSVVPLKYSKVLSDTIFRDEYLEEKLFTYIDNLNLLYVAFTRAKHRLIMFAPFKDKTDKLSDVSHLIREAVTNNQLSQSNLSEGDTECLFELGSPDKLKNTDIDSEVKTYRTGKWHSVPFNDRLKLRLNSIGFFSDDGSRDYGKLMHEVVSNVKTLSDIPQAIKKKISEGEINESEQERLIAELTEYLSLPAVLDWYSDKYTVLNETQLLHPQKGFSRPDRIMIAQDEVIIVDYKFGESEDRKYNRQVQRYVKSIEEMGYPTVKGYVFYVKTGKLLEVG
ncbi:MAG: UvrD-helicase domain-containing protein [Fermentimonas sp.]|nr:UvrD-helicase domain-containing protein [Fermentimonas sp.]